MELYCLLSDHWDICSDELGIKVKVRDPICTRRDLLSIMSSTYDPLGLVGPSILVAKKIFQSECRFEKGWDEPLSDENRRSWLQWLHELHVLANFCIDRCVIMTGVSLCEVRHFCDASQDAYGSVCYLRTVTFDGQVRCVLLLAKSRLAPLKTVMNSGGTWIVPAIQQMTLHVGFLQLSWCLVNGGPRGRISCGRIRRTGL